MKTADRISFAVIFTAAVYFLARFAAGILFNV
jgi:hypothetical protein